MNRIKLENKENKPLVVLDALSKNKINNKSVIAYKTKHYVAVLTYLGSGSYGFVYLQHSNCSPAFTSTSRTESIGLAINQNRRVYLFESIKELQEKLEN